LQVITLGEELNTPIVLCLGYFGCMHKGHVELLKTAQELAEEKNAETALFTFSNNHLRVLGVDVSLLYTFEERLEIYDTLNVGYVVVSKFDSEFRNTSGEKFLQTLNDNFNIKGIVCGFDHTCGRDRLNSSDISEYFKGVCPVKIVEQISLGNEKISTTLVRKLLGEQKIAEANSLLSEPFFVEGTVVKGRGIGKKLGFPTANLQVTDDKFLPTGVYAGRTIIDGKPYRCIVNIGCTPTFGIDQIVTEVNLLNFDGDLYGKQLKVSITRFMRNITHFSTAQELSAQLCRDKEDALND